MNDEPLSELNIAWNLMVLVFIERLIFTPALKIVHEWAGISASNIKQGTL